MVTFAAFSGAPPGVAVRSPRRHPRDFPRIPAVPVGTYAFPPALAARFWAEILAEHA